MTFYENVTQTQARTTRIGYMAHPERDDRTTRIGYTGHPWKRDESIGYETHPQEPRQRRKHGDAFPQTGMTNLEGHVVIVTS